MSILHICLWFCQARIPSLSHKSEGLVCTTTTWQTYPESIFCCYCNAGTVDWRLMCGILSQSTAEGDVWNCGKCLGSHSPSSLISVAGGLLSCSLWEWFKPSDVFVCFSQCCMSVLCRLSRFVVSLRSWATRHLHHEDQRPDSFLERIRGPELIEVSSRQSNIRSFLGIRERPGGVNR